MNSPGRYESSGKLGALAEALLQEGMADAQTGNSDWGDGAALIRGRFKPSDFGHAHQWPEYFELDATERAALDAAAGMIVSWSTDGFLRVRLYATEAELDSAWGEIEEQYGGYAENSQRPPPLPPRRGRTDAHRRVARAVRDDRGSFDPARRYPRETKRHHFAVNHHHRSGGLASDRHLLDQLTEMAAESMELENWKDARATDTVVEEAARYDAALADALDALVIECPPERGTADDLWDANGPYLVLMTLRGEGVGIWDGDWESFYPDTSEAELFLKARLSRFADVTGGGSFGVALMNAADETAGGDLRENRHRRNVRGGGEADVHAARELMLFLENDQRFAPGSPTGMGRAITKNQLRKWQAGMWSRELSVKGWMHLADAAAKAYAEEIGGSFDRPTRRAVAEELTDDFAAQARAGELAHIDTSVRR